MKKAFMVGLYAAMATMASSVGKTLQPRKNNFNFGLNIHKYTKGNPTRWRSVKQDLQTQSQKRHRADKEENKQNKQKVFDKRYRSTPNLPVFY